MEGSGGLAPPIYGMGGPRQPQDDGIGRQINDLENDQVPYPSVSSSSSSVQDAAPFDELRIYDDERDNVSMVTLESIDSVGVAPPPPTRH